MARSEERVIGGDEKRTESLKQTIHGAVVWMVRVAAFVGLLVFIARMWHLISPDCWSWLDTDRIHKIDQLLFSGALGGLIVKYLEQAVPTNGKNGKPEPPAS